METCCPHDLMDFRARAAMQFMIFQWWKHFVLMTLWTWEQERLYSLYISVVETCCPHDFMDLRARAPIQFMIFQLWKHVFPMTLWTWEQGRLYSLWYLSGGSMLSSWLYGLESKSGYTVYDILVVETICPHDFTDFRARAATVYDILVVETCCPHDFMDLRARAAIQFMIF